MLEVHCVEMAELSFPFGVFHHLNNWRNIIQKMLLTTSRFVLFDLRLTSENSPLSFQKMALMDDWDQKTIVPYNVINIHEMLTFLKTLALK